MSPEAAFSSESKRLYRWLSKRVDKLDDHQGLIIFAGRERPHSGRPERVYVKVVKRGCADPGAVVYFEHKPTKQDFKDLMKTTIKGMNNGV